MLSGLILLDQIKLNKLYKKLLFYLLGILKFLWDRENHGKVFYCMVLLVQVRHILPKHVLQKWKKVPSFLLVQVISCQNTLDNQRKLSRLYLAWQEKRSHQSSLLTKLTQWEEIEEMDKTKQVEESKHNFQFKWMELEHNKLVFQFLEQPIFLGLLIQLLEEDLKEEFISVFQMKLQEKGYAKNYVLQLQTIQMNKILLNQVKYLKGNIVFIQLLRI